jgi:hypothetical protein
MILKDFLYTFRSCPMCGDPLQMSATNNNDVASWSKNHNFIVRQSRDKITLFIKSDYYVSEGKRDFEFTISIHDGSIIHCGQTSKFISLYELDILLTKSCSNCANRSPRGAFQKNIRIFYDRTYSKFASENYTEFFLTNDDENSYYFCNDFQTHQSHISVSKIGLDRISYTLVPYIPFEKFNFIYKHKLITKLQSIQILV